LGRRPDDVANRFGRQEARRGGLPAPHVVHGPEALARTVKPTLPHRLDRRPIRKTLIRTGAPAGVRLRAHRRSEDGDLT
jgi:hypothetical protein